MATHSSTLAWKIPRNPTDRGAWWAAVRGVAKSRTRLSTHAAISLYLPAVSSVGFIYSNLQAGEGHMEDTEKCFLLLS